jgi:hypothetical protein
MTGLFLPAFLSPRVHSPLVILTDAPMNPAIIFSLSELRCLIAL